MGKYDRENSNLYSNLLDEIKQNFNLDNEGAEAALLLIRERALSLELSLSEYMRTYHPQGFSEKDNSLNEEYKGYIKFIGEDAASIIKTGKTADFSTFTHEIAHGFRRQLSGDLKVTAEKAFKVENGQWTHVQEEAFAVGFEEYIRLRLTENEELEKVFEKGSLYMQRVYNGLDRIIELNPEIIKVYDQMFTHGRFQFNQEEFDKTIDKIENFKDETSKFSSSHVYLGMTPPIYQELGFERLPVMITAKHLQNIMAETGKDKNTNYHGFTADMIKQIPETIKKPLIIMQSQNKGNEEDIIAVIELKDTSGHPIIIPFSPNKKGNFNDIEIDINLAKTIYGKESFDNFLNKAIKENRILYLNEKSRDIVPPELQLLRNYKSQLLYNNIAEYHKAVKGKNPDFNILYQKQAYYSGGQFEFDFLNDPEKKEEQKMQEKPIQAKNEDKLSVNTENKQNTGILVQTDKIKILNNTEMERVQIFFPGAPNEEIRNDLKSHGWRWSPRNFCWQRLNTENGLNDAIRIFDKWYRENEKIILTKEDYDKPTAKNKEKDYNETEQNKGKQNGKNNQGVQDKERNRNTGNGGERNKDEGRNTGLDDSRPKRGRTETIGRSIDESSRDEIPESLQDGQRERSKVGNSHEPQNGQRNNSTEYQVIPNQPRNGLIDDEKKPLKEVKSIREKCLNLLNSKKDHEFTQEDKKLLSQYEGGGGTGEENRSTSGVLYEFYTPNSVVNKVWELVDSYAPNAKTVLEPSGGTGRFIQGRDKNECTLIELDKTSSRIASILHPNAEVKNQAFQELFFKDGVIHKENYEGKKYDLVIGNPPYGDYTGIYKGKGEGEKHSRYEQYFIERGLDTLNENGILAFVLPSSFLSNGENEGKRLIASKGELIDAWRLPAGVFNTTDVGTDIVIIKKGQGNIKDFCSDTFFSLNPDHILGEEKEVSGRFGKPEKKIIPFNKYSTQETLNLIVPQKNISFTAIENMDVSKAKEKNENPIKKEKNNEVKEVKNNVSQSFLLSAGEFSLKYEKEIDKRELPIWKLTDYEGKINESAMTKEDIDFIRKNPNYVKIDSSLWMHIVNYTKGNIYAKLDELEKEAHKIDFQVYLKRKKILQNAIPEKISYEKINIPVHSSIAQEFIVERNPDGTYVNLQEGFIKWATGEKEQAQAQANNFKNYTSTYYIDYEYSPLNKNDMPENIGWYDIISFINKEPVRARAADGIEEKKAAQIEAQKKRNTRRDTAERLFNRYIQEGVPQHLKDELCDMWNRRFNGYVNPDYTKFPLFVEGMNRFKNGEEFTLYDQQIKGVSFLSNKGNGLLAYDVGVGKTACGIVFNANQIQSGRAKRPLICVPKSVYSKWVKDIKELFPNIKVNELGNFSKDVLKPFAADDHGLNIPEKSISVCTIEALQKITFMQKTIDNEIAADLLDARLNLTGNARTDAQDKERVYEILGGATQAKDDDYIFWEKTGFDSITVDEAHRFKNLFTIPRGVKENEKQTANEFEGIGSGVTSKRAQKLFAITQFIQKENDGRNVCLLTATPFTNSPTEVYSMLSYVARQKLKDMHIYNLSAFLTEFAETKTEWVVKPKGDIQPKQVMKSFKNLKSLQNLLTEYIDKVDAEEAGVIRPEKKPHVIELGMNDIQKKIIEAETKRIQNASKDDPGAVLVAMNNMRMALLSPALVNPVYDFELPPPSKIVESSPKLTFVCDSIIASYKKEPQGGQVMYMPRGVMEFSHVKNYLVSHGIPKDAIALVSSSTTNAQKDKITEDFNDKNKKLKIIIGSETISEGIDLNGNSFALYNTMLGWNPTESIQVEGRIWRQGNEQGHVHIVYPVIYDSIDSLMLQKHDEKSSRIKDLWSYKGDKLNVEHIHPEELKFDLIKDPIKKADFLIEQRISSFKRDISIINMKIKSIDEIIEKRKEYKEEAAYYEVRNDKKKLSFFKNRLASLDKKCKSFGITSEAEQYTVIAKLNKEKQELDVKIDGMKNEKNDFIKKFIAEAEKSQKQLLPIDEIVKDNCNKILNDLCPMEKLKKQYKIKNNQSNEVKKVPDIGHSVFRTDKVRTEAVPLKTYKQAPFEFMVAEKKSDFFGVKSPPHNKKETLFLNTKAPGHKKTENSLER